jgi:signal transduction histidine kinase
MLRRGLVVWLAAIAFGLASEATAWSWDPPGHWLPDLAAGTALLTCGLVATRLRPNGWTGWLLSAAGLLWFVPNFSETNSMVVAELAAALLFAHRGPLLHAILTYPLGRTAPPVVGGAVVLSYGAAVGQAFWPQPWLAISAAGLVLAVSLGRYAGSVRSDRRARLFALAAATAWAVLICGEELARGLSRGDRLDAELLTAYELSVAVVAVILTVGLRQTSWERALVSDLVVELGAAPSGGLRGELAAVLGDPGLEVGWWVEETASYVDGDGRLLRIGLVGDDRSVTPVLRDGRPVAVLVHDSAVLTDPALVEAVGAAVGLVAANARLRAEVGERVADVAASRLRIVQAADEQRRLLEARVHEGALRRLDQLAALLDDAQATAHGDRTTQQVEGARERLARTEEELRRLARGLHPRDLVRRGLAATLTELADESALLVRVEGTASAPPDIEAAAYFVCSEALANATKHSNASTVTITLGSREGAVIVEVADDGVGGAHPVNGTGLQGLEDRVGALGGTLEVVSPPRGGTRVVAVLPTGLAAGAG